LICAEYQRLGIHHREHRHLRISFWIKLAFIFIEVACAIAFGVLDDRDHYNSAAVMEWIVALIYTFYVWSFAIDFIPIITIKIGYKTRETEVEAATEMEQDSRNNGYPAGMQEEQVNGNARNAHKAEPVEPSRNF
jgi:D-alanyl-lipoteichoic acid acyltransferase DltB (MBOAT superfamily)